MEKLAIVDLDGVIADSTERFIRATRADGSTNWKIAFDPSLVELDQLVPGALEAIDNLEHKNFTVIFLTSRPETMREATELWLGSIDMEGFDLVMKPASKQFTKTIVWKAEEVRRMAMLPGVELVHFIDDEERNRQAIEALDLGIVCASSLDNYKPDDTPIII